MSTLIPFVSTHFQWKKKHPRQVTYNKVYVIERWEQKQGGCPCFLFINNQGTLSTWYHPNPNAVDASFSTMLERVLGE